MPRFVVLEHDHPFLHWDFLLEAGKTLRTWRLHARPDAGGVIAAEPLPDHRPVYLDYEGPVSGGRGEVKRWDAGEFAWTEGTSDQCTVTLTGRKLAGQACLRRVGTAHHSTPSPRWVEGRSPPCNWEFVFTADSVR
ncbi:MAG: DNA polymerase ligase N-terminal domain-containing protein [Planctomycetaceae bacterium]